MYSKLDFYYKSYSYPYNNPSHKSNKSILIKDHTINIHFKTILTKDILNKSHFENNTQIYN